ncbi:hypothetical protein ILUMI_14995, partial [Ignelater luminosus]
MAVARKIRKYSIEDMEKALDAGRRGVSVASASKDFGISRITLLYKSKGKYPVNVRMGPETILTLEEEKLLVKWLLRIAEVGFPATKQLWQKWYKGFTARHSEISARLTQNLTKCRSDLTEGKIRNWFQEINDYLTANHLEAVVKDSQRIYNADETAFFLAPKGMKCLIQKGDKTAYSFIGNDEKECLTCLMTPNASGDLRPPLIIYNYERLPAHIISMMPKKWAIGKSESGWMTSQIILGCQRMKYPDQTNAINYARYFKDDKYKSDVVNAKPNLEFKVKNEFLEYLEAKLGNEKLSNFKLEEEADDWSGEVKDTNLFMLWKNIRNELKMLKEQTNLKVSELQETNGSLPDSSINPNVDIDETRLRIENTPENNFQRTITGGQSFHSKNEATYESKRFKENILSVGRNTTVKSKKNEKDELEKKNRNRVREEKKKEAERLKAEKN